MPVYNNSINTPRLTTAGQFLIGSSISNPAAAVITPGAGINISNGNGAVVISADAAITNVNQILFDDPGMFTYTPSVGLQYAFVQVMGGGGGGGGSANTTSDQVCLGSGAGGAGYVEGYISAATIGVSQAIAVGAGGAGVVNDDGFSGEDSTFGSLLLGGGGGGGLVGFIDTNFTPGGSPGGFAGTALLYGYPGQLGGYSGPGSNGTPLGYPAFTYSGYGGGTFTSANLGGVNWAVNTGLVSIGGIDGSYYGGGGGGSLSAIGGAQAAGGDGYSGFVIVTEYISAP